MKKRILSLFLAFALAFSFTACDKNNNNNETKQETENKTDENCKSLETENTVYPLNIKDMLGNEISFSQKPEKIVVLNPDSAEIVNELKGAKDIVAIGQYVDYPEEILEKPKLQTGDELNAEEIIKLNPDVIFVSDMAQTAEQFKTIKDAGISVVTFNAKDLNGVYEEIDLIGKILDKNKEAKDLIGSMKYVFDEIAKDKEANKGKSIYFEVSPLEYGLWSAGKGTFMQRAADMLGLKNIFDDVEGWKEISEEEVIKRNPDYIMTITMYSGSGDKPEEEIMKRTGWEEISAVKNKKILNLQNNELSRPSPRLKEGFKLLSDFVK